LWGLIEQIEASNRFISISEYQSLDADSAEKKPRTLKQSKEIEDNVTSPVQSLYYKYPELPTLADIIEASRHAMAQHQTKKLQARKLQDCPVRIAMPLSLRYTTL
jgi:ADP-dependent phosphofructokinase/glucokinase